jgi:hypothetical protein
MADLQKMKLESELNTLVADVEMRRARSTELYSYEERSGRCIDCGSHISITAHVMRDNATGEQWTDSRRDECC